MKDPTAVTAPSSSDAPSSGPDPMALARAALAEGRRRRAKRYLREAEAKGLTPAARMEAALMMARAEAPDEARRLAGDLPSRDSDDIRAEMMRLRLLSALGDDPAALELCRDLVRRFPGDARPALALAERLQAAGDTGAALETVGGALEAGGDHAGLRLMRAELLDRTGERNAARTEAAALAETPPDDPRGVLRLARLCARLRAGPAERAVLAVALDTETPDPALLAHLLRRAFETSSDAVGLSRRADALAGLLRPAQMAELRRDLAFGMADHAAALAEARTGGARSPAEAAELARALLGLNRAETAARYLAFCARRWPRALPVLRARFAALRAMDDLDGAARLLDGFDAGDSADHARGLRALRLQLAIARGTLDTGAVLDDLAAEWLDDDRTMRMLMQHFIARADVASAGRLDRLALAAGALGPRQRWTPRRVAQLWTELQLTRAHFGEEELTRLAGADATTLAEAARGAPWSYVLAQLVVTRHATDSPAAPPVIAQTPRSETESGTERPVPAVIHQYWSEQTPPEQVLHFCESWKAAPGYEHRLHTRSSALQMLRTDFGPQWVQAFRMVKRPPEASDFLRLCLMARYGGVWTDANNVLTGDLDRLVGGGEGLVVVHEPLSGAVTNTFLAARPRHPAMVYAARLARQDLLRRSGETVWLKTGPGLVTRAVGQYIAAEKPADHEAGALRLLDEGTLRREVALHLPLPLDRASARWNDPRGEIPDLVGLVDHVAERHRGAAA